MTTPYYAPFGNAPFGTTPFGAPPPTTVITTPITVTPVGYGALQVSWVPLPLGWSEQILLRSSFGPPVSVYANDGVVLLDETPADGGTSLYLDTGLQPGYFYYYTLFQRTGNEYLVAATAQGLAITDWGFGKTFARWLPDWYLAQDALLATPNQPEGPLTRFLNLLGYEMDWLRSEIESLALFSNVNMVSGSLLPYLGGNYGVTYEPALGVTQSRVLAANAVNLYKQRGTNAGIKAAASAFSGYGVNVEIGKNLLVQLDDGAFDRSVGHWVPTTAGSTVELASSASVGVEPAHTAYSPPNASNLAVLSSTTAGVVGYATCTPLTAATLGIPVVGGSTDTYVFSAYFQPDPASGVAVAFEVGLVWYSLAGIVISTESVSVTETVGSWVRGWVAGSPPPGAEVLGLTVTSGAALGSDTHLMDAAQLEVFPAVGNLVPDSNLTNAIASVGPTWTNNVPYGTDFTFGGGAGELGVDNAGTDSAALVWHGNGTTGTNNMLASQPVPVTPGATYELSALIENGAGSGVGASIVLGDLGYTTNYAATESQAEGVSSVLSATWTVPAGVTAVLVIPFCYGTVASGVDISWSQIQLTETSTVEPYEPGPLWPSAWDPPRDIKVNLLPARQNLVSNPQGLGGATGWSVSGGTIQASADMATPPDVTWPANTIQGFVLTAVPSGSATDGGSIYGGAIPGASMLGGAIEGGANLSTNLILTGDFAVNPGMAYTWSAYVAPAGDAPLGSGETVFGTEGLTLPSGVTSITNGNEVLGSLTLDPWTVGAGTPAAQSTPGDPGPSINVPSGAYLFYDFGVAPVTIEVDIYTTALGDFFFGCDSTGAGYMARLDARGGGVDSGFATTSSWTTWDGPTSSATDLAPFTWYHFVISIANGVANLTIDGVPATPSFAVSSLGTYLGLIGDGGGGSTNFANLVVNGEPVAVGANFNFITWDAAPLPAGASGNLVYDSNLTQAIAAVGPTWNVPSTFSFEGSELATIGSANGDFDVLNAGADTAEWVYYGTGSASANVVLPSQVVNVTPGATYTLSAFIDATAATAGGGRNPGVELQAPYGAGTSEYVIARQNPGVSGVVSGTVTIPGGVTQVVPVVVIDGVTVTAGATVSWSQIQLTEGSTVQPYAPGPLWTYPVYRNGYEIGETTALAFEDTGQPNGPTVPMANTSSPLLSPPPPPTVTVEGTGGSTTYGYQVGVITPDATILPPQQFQFAVTYLSSTGEVLSSPIFSAALTEGLMEGVAINALEITSLAYPVSAGVSFMLEGANGAYQLVLTAQSTPAGATTLAVQPFVPNGAYAVGANLSFFSSLVESEPGMFVRGAVINTVAPLGTATASVQVTVLGPASYSAYYFAAPLLEPAAYLAPYFDASFEPATDFLFEGADNDSVSDYYPGLAAKASRLLAVLPDYIPIGSTFSLVTGADALESLGLTG